MDTVRTTQAGRRAAGGADVSRDGEDVVTGEEGGNDERGAVEQGEQELGSLGGGVATGDLTPLHWWEGLSLEQFRAIAASDVLGQQHPREKKLNIEDFTGAYDESVEAWLATVHNEVERQQTLDGGQWTSRQQFQGASARLKNKAADWFVNMNARLKPEDRTFVHFVVLLRGAFGSNECLLEVQLRVGRREQQPAERLQDFATNLRGIALGHDVPEECLVDAFISGINSPLMSTHVRVRGPQTLAEAVQVAVKTGGPYGAGYKIKDWRAAERDHRDSRILTEREDGTPPPAPAQQHHGESLDALDAAAVTDIVGRAVAMQRTVALKKEAAATEGKLVEMHTEA
jgi:hypothetical protein